MRLHLIANHLESGYSDFVFASLKKMAYSLNRESIILDIGCGQGRHLKLVKHLGLGNLFGIDRLEPRDHDFYAYKQHDVEEGIPFPEQFADLTLASFLLMYISEQKRAFVVDELLRVTKQFLIIETNRPRQGETYMYRYSFKEILKRVQLHSEFEIIQVRKSFEKILMKRRG